MEENIIKVQEVVKTRPTESSGRIKYDDWKKVEIKIGQILTVERIKKSEKLLKLSVDFGLKPSIDGLPEQHVLGNNRDIRQIISGIAKYFPDISVLVNKKCAFVTNLEPKPLMGLESNGMILAVGGGEEPFSIFEVKADIKVGTQAK